MALFLRTLQTAFSSEQFHEKTHPFRIEEFVRDSKFFLSLRRSVQQRYAETIDYKEYEARIKKLVDTHVTADEVVQISGEANEKLADAGIRVQVMIEKLKIVDWQTNPDVEKNMRNDIEDYLLEISESLGVDLSFDEIDLILEQAIKIAKTRPMEKWYRAHAKKKFNECKAICYEIMRKYGIASPVVDYFVECVTKLH